MRWFRPRALPRLLALAATLLLLYPTPCRGWERDVLVVLTWHSASIDWLRVLPASVVRVALFAKPGGIASCEAVPVRVKRLVASCTEVHNYGGREAHTMAAFMEAFYDDLPRVVVFAQDDCPAFPRGELFHPRSTVLGRTVECGVLRLAAWSLPEVDAWLARVEAAPGAWATKDNCLCTLVDEPFRQCEEGVPSEHLPCAGAGFYAMQARYAMLYALKQSLCPPTLYLSMSLFRSKLADWLATEPYPRVSTLRTR